MLYLLVVCHVLWTKQSYAVPLPEVQDRLEPIIQCCETLRSDLRKLHDPKRMRDMCDDIKDLCKSLRLDLPATYLRLPLSASQQQQILQPQSQPHQRRHHVKNAAARFDGVATLSETALTTATASAGYEWNNLA